MTNNNVRRDIPVSPLSITNLAHMLRHAPTYEEGARITKRAFRVRRMDRTMIHYSKEASDD